MNDLTARATKMFRTGEPFRLVGTVRSIQFLRGVFSRASMCLPAFYYFLGSASTHESAKSTDDYPFKIAQTYSEFSDLSTLTLACRKIFDHATKPDLTGANFGKLPDHVLLFGHIQVHQQARFHWKHQEHESIQSYFDQLQWALG